MSPDGNADFVIQACKRIRSYLEEIRVSIESNAQGPVITLDFDSIGQLLMPQKRSSSQVGLLWHGVMTARQLRQGNFRIGGADSSSAATIQKFQIPEGSKRELRYFCQKLLREYQHIIQGRTAQKLGLEPEDFERILTTPLSGDELGRIVHKFRSVNASLSLLDSLLDKDIEFSHLDAPQPTDVRFQDYLQGSQRNRNTEYNDSMPDRAL